jgi:hypothetical protein
MQAQLPSGCIKTFFCTYQKCDTLSPPASRKYIDITIFKTKSHMSITGHTTASTHGIIKESSYDENEKVSISSYCFWRTKDSQTLSSEV